MKLTDFVLIFIMIISPFVLVLRIQSDNLQNSAFRNIVVNRYLDAAVEDASNAMIIRGDGGKVTISREKAIEAFHTSLFTNFNVLNNEAERNRFAVFVPVIALIDYDGYYVCSMEEYLNISGEKEQKMVWKPKKTYTYERDGYVYIFTLDQKVTVYNSVSNEFTVGMRKELEPVIGEDIIQDTEIFEQVRKRTIVEALKIDITEAINLHNAYAVHFGITYCFSPPSISDADWYKNIEDVGFLAFFQGLPTGLNGEYYNNFALGAARIVRKSKYFIQEAQNGLLYYHREQCAELSEKDKVYDTREECALKGAFPCPLCTP